MQKQINKYTLHLGIILFIVVLIMNTETIFYIVCDKANGITKNQDIQHERKEMQI